MSEQPVFAGGPGDATVSRRRVRTPPHPVDEHVGRRIQARRKQLGMSQNRLAEALGVTFQQVQKYERGSNRISASRLQHVADILGVQVSHFFDGAYDPSQSHDDGPEAPSEIDWFLASDEGVALARAFSRIRDPVLRRSIAVFVLNVAGAHAPPAGGESGEPESAVQPGKPAGTD